MRSSESLVAWVEERRRLYNLVWPMIFFSKVEAAFTVPTRGCVIVPTAVTTTVHIGEAIQLRSPHGDVIDTRIVGIELIKNLSVPCEVGLMLSKEVAKEDVPLNAEIWINDSK
jgi:hypothetical protein